MDSFHPFLEYNAPTLGRVLNTWKPEQSPVALQIPASTLHKTDIVIARN